jgi:trimethylamine:corrinoid methyltransferase-like protein
LESGELHDSTYKDLEKGFLFADALDMIEIVNVMISASDVPGHERILRHFALAFTQTSKHVRSGVHHAREVPLLVEMVKAVTGDDSFRPIFSAVD